MSLKEVAARFVLETLLPPIRVNEIPNASYAAGKTLESEGKWDKALQHFYTLALREGDPDLRGQSLVESAQMCINYGRVGQARKYLTMAETVVSSQLGDDGEYLRARVWEKSAWIDDYEGNFAGSLEKLSSARTALQKIPLNAWGDGEKSLESTINHFSARAHIGLAIKGESKKENLANARSYLERELSNNLPPDNRGFQFAWLARVALLEGNLSQAELYITEAKKLWSEKSRGILAHYYLLEGALAMARGDPNLARRNFEQALNIRVVVEKYPKGEADALMGIAATYWAEGQIGAAGMYAARSVRTYPLVVFRGGM